MVGGYQDIKSMSLEFEATCIDCRFDRSFNVPLASASWDSFGGMVTFIVAIQCSSFK